LFFHPLGLFRFPQLLGLLSQQGFRFLDCFVSCYFCSGIFDFFYSGFCFDLGFYFDLDSCFGLDFGLDFDFCFGFGLDCFYFFLVLDLQV